MLPFMKPKKIASIIMQKRNEQNKVTEERPEDGESSQMLDYSAQLISAVEAKDATKAAQAMRAAHEHLSKQTDAPGTPESDS